jgi:hypothetical protein
MTSASQGVLDVIGRRRQGDRVRALERGTFWLVFGGCGSAPESDDAQEEEP